MKKLLLILLLFSCVKIDTFAQTYYISVTGSDVTGTGTSGNPWASLSYAASQVTSGTIHVNPGTYTEDSQVVVAPGVSIEGNGANYSIINSTYTDGAGLNSALIQLYSTNVTSTSQHISGIKLDGNLTGDKAIVVYNRSGVSIYSCTVIDFVTQGVRFHGNANCTGNSIYNCTITNSGGYDTDEHACLALGYNTGILVYSNIINQTGRGVGSNGIGLQGNDALYGSKIYNNSITGLDPNAPNTNNPFAVEFWNSSHTAGFGTEFYGNTFVGMVDFGSGVTKGSYPYGVYFHNNIFGDDTVYPEAYTHRGLQLEEDINDVIIANNLFKNLECAIYFCCQATYQNMQNIWIYENKIINIAYGYTVHTVPGGYTSHGTGIDFGGNTRPGIVANVYIWNNDILAYTTRPAEVGIWLPTAYDCDNVYVQNNIIIGFVTAAIKAEEQATGGTLNTLVLQKNVLYGNGNSNNLQTVNFTPTNVTNDGGIKSDPQFVSPTDLHLSSSSSPAYHAGVTLTFPYELGDYSGATRSTSVGCYEYSASTPVAPTVTTTAASGVTSTTASTGGNVTSDGDATVTDRGVCYNTSLSPTISNSHTHNGTGEGAFTSSLTGLLPNTTYYVRAYATNSIGTSYGSNMSFTTSVAANEGFLKSGDEFLKSGTEFLKFSGTLNEYYDPVLGWMIILRDLGNYLIMDNDDSYIYVVQ